jgi:LysR family transcriptional regulator for metE and metH
MDVNLEIRHLKLIAAIAEEESVTAAARRLFLTQSALSHQLRDAEEKLGTPLFLRLGKRMALTPAGTKLLECARRILAELHDAESQVRQMNGGMQGLIRLSTECYTCYHWLPPVLERFHLRFPRIEVNIDLDGAGDPAERVLAGKLDVAVMSCPPPNKSLYLAPLGEDEMVLVMSPRHPLAEKRSIKPHDLAQETLLIYPPRAESTLIRKVLEPAGIQPFRVMEIPLTEAIMEMAAAGTGVAFIAHWAAAPYAESGRVAARPLCDSGFHRQWFAVTLNRQPMAAYMKEFLSLLSLDCSKYMRRLSASAAAL